MATYYLGADVHTNNTELAIEQRGRIVARYSVPTTIPAISTVLSGGGGSPIEPLCRLRDTKTLSVFNELSQIQKGWRFSQAASPLNI